MSKLVLCKDCESLYICLKFYTVNYIEKGMIKIHLCYQARYVQTY